MQNGYAIQSEKSRKEALDSMNAILVRTNSVDQNGKNGTIVVYHEIERLLEMIEIFSIGNNRCLNHFHFSERKKKDQHWIY